MENTFIPKGMEIVKAAVEADNRDELPAALSLYKQALSYFMTGLKYVKLDKQKQAIRERMEQYVIRAEEIKKLIDENGGGPKKTVIAEGAGGEHHKEGGEGGGGEGGGGGGSGDNKDGHKKDKKDKKKDADQEKLDGALESAIVRERPDVKWSDVSGLEQAKNLLKEAVILPVKFPQLFTGKRKPWKGILLYGPPGTGKTFLAKAVATEAGASCFFSVSSSDLVSQYQGESERLVRTLFDLARKNSPSIIFIDEVDSLCSARGQGENESSRRIKTEFLVQMQGVGKSDEGILVLGATNVPWELDAAIRRRFEKRVYIPLPEEEARVHLFRTSIGNTPHTLNEINLKQLASITDGYSGADISIVVRDALYEPIRIIQVATHFKKISDPNNKHPFLWEPCSPGDPAAVEMSLYDIPSELLHPIPTTMRHFENVLANAKPSVASGDLEKFIEWTKQFGQEG